MKRKVIILTLILIALSNCTRKTLYTCGLADLALKPKIESNVLQLARIAIADTTIASISGEIFGKDSSGFGVIIDTSIYACVYLIDKVTGKNYGNLADSNGKYQFHFPASTYDLKVQSIAYNTLIVQNVTFGTGDVVRFNAILGASGTQRDSTVYVMQADKTIKMLNQPIKGK